MKEYLGLFKQTFREFGEDKAPRLGAALAYYTIFSIAPLLLIAVSIAGLVFGQEAAMGQISAQLKSVFGPDTAKALEEMIEKAAKPKEGTAAAIIGVAMLLFGAAGVFGQLKDALNTIWDIEGKKAGGIISIIRQRFFSILMVMGVGFLLLVTLVFDATIAAAGKYMGGRLPGGEGLLQVLQLVISFGLVSLVFALIFRYVPDIRVPWRDVWRGAVLTAILFVLGKFGLGMYIGKAAVGSTYGAAGSLVVLLIWVYWSAQILFFGAEFTQVYARSREADRVVPASRRPLEPKAAETAAPHGLGRIAGLVVAMIVAMRSVKRALLIPFK